MHSLIDPFNGLSQKKAIDNSKIPFGDEWYPLNPFEDDKLLECGIENPEVCESCE